MLKETLKRNKGITLIALVVTIIVLLILAGISINMLTGENGILNRAAEAKEKTENAQTEEKLKLAVTDAITTGTGELTEENLKVALNNIGISNENISGSQANGWTVKDNGKNYKISPIGNIKELVSLPMQKDVTEPYLPTDDFEMEKGTDLSTGLVVKDSSGNEYVWVEVPKTIYTDTKYNTTGTTIKENEWEKIRDCLKEYTKDYSSSSYKDTNTDGTTYSVDYQNMLKSVYTNGGFWIGRYEAGLEEGNNPRTSYTAISPSDKAVVKQNKIPYNYVKRDEAQELATRMNYNGCTSSLIFGIQWDLVLKYIETKKPDQKANLTSDSTKIGNYYNSEFTLNRGKFAKIGELSDWKSYNSEEKPTLVTGSKKKEQSSDSNAILLTTGATEATKLQNIYDIAGNVWEWTLEFCNTSRPCVFRGGSYNNVGSNNPAKTRVGNDTSYSYLNVGFRLGLWR